MARKNMDTSAAATPDVASVNGLAPLSPLLFLLAFVAYLILLSSSGVINGGTHVDDVEVDEDINNEELTPPPDTPESLSPEISPASISPPGEPMSRTSSLPLNVLEDEIVVGTNANKHLLLNKPSPRRLVSESLDVDMDDVDDESVASQKRKRTSTYSDMAVDDVPSPAPRSQLPDARPRPPVKQQQKTHGVGGVKGTLLGYWRDSEPEDPKDKHAVIGFIDVRDRLRTRIQPTTREGRSIVHDYPLPPGPGGSWVTFQQVAFDEHLVFLNQHQVKEYVKIRVERQSQGETLEERKENETAAVKEAIRRVEENPPPPTATEPLVAYGPEIPEHAQPQSRPESKKRKLNASLGPSATGTPVVNQQPLDNIPGTRPTRILLGYWRLSQMELVTDKHAVYGILGANDMFRVKLMKETRDGRPIIGNFPAGAGALWIHWDEVEFDPHLRNLTRPEIKEYCRIRQRQLDDGETPEERVSNETLAVYEAQKRVANSLAMGAPGPKREDYGSIPIAMKTAQVANGNGYEDGHAEFSIPTGSDLPPLEPRPRRTDAAPRGRHSLPDVELRAANRPPGPTPLERTNSIARREIARAEAAAQRAEQRNLSRESYSGPALALPPPNSNSMQFHDSVSRLNMVWAAQEANRLKVGAEDAKIYMGIKYERKQNGPFEGKLVSQGTIISIDGEDYVEYRVLTKPSFF